MDIRKTVRIAVREYLAAVRTKGFIIGLAVAPIFMFGSIIVMAIAEGRVDTSDKVVAVIDRSGVVADGLVKAAEERNETQAHDPETGKKVKPLYVFEVVESDEEDPVALRLALSDRVRNGELHGFLEIGPEALHPGESPEASRVAYYAKNAALDDVRQWLGWPLNGQLRRSRLAELGVDDSAATDLMTWLSVEGLGLVSRDEKTGAVQDARRTSKEEALLIPVGFTMLVYFMILMGSISMLSSVMEEKTQRIAEVLLSTVRPIEFMTGKVIGGVAVSMTGALVYISAALIVLSDMELLSYFPMHVLPWFFMYMVLAVFMFGAMNAALGAVCNDPKDAQNLTFPAIVPIIIPLFFMFPIAKEPLSAFSTWMSLVPPFVPTLMIARMATPVDIPIWQPFMGLLLLVLFTVAAVWAGSRVFRVAILMQGNPPKLSNLIRWAIRG